MSDIIKPVIIPGGVDNLTLPDPDLLNQYIDLDNRVIWIDDEINTFTLNVIQYIIYWNRADKDIPPEERKPIKILFFTQGGMLDIYNSVADVIELSIAHTLLSAFITVSFLFPFTFESFIFYPEME